MVRVSAFTPSAAETVGGQDVNLGPAVAIFIWMTEGIPSIKPQQCISLSVCHQWDVTYKQPDRRHTCDSVSAASESSARETALTLGGSNSLWQWNRVSGKWLHSLKVATGEKEPRPGPRTRSLRPNTEFQLHKPPVWPRFSNSNLPYRYGHRWVAILRPLKTCTLRICAMVRSAGI